MQVILLEKVRNLGELGEQVKVRGGYARNYLIPQQKAVPANKANVELFESKRAELEQKAKDLLAQAQTRADELRTVKIEIAANAGEEGKLFGSITNHDVIDAFKAQGYEVSRRDVILPEGPIRTIGEHSIQISLHSDVIFDFTVNVVAE